MIMKINSIIPIRILVLFMFMIGVPSVLAARAGKVEEFYPSGALKAIRFYKGDMREGVSKIFYENGKLMSDIHYHEDLLDGLYKSYYENGDVYFAKNINW